jgi:hypothetical protein
MPVPKVACTTVKIALHAWEGVLPDDRGAVHDRYEGLSLLDHGDAEILELLTSDDVLRFCFVRNPYGRLFSAWKSKLAWDDPQYERLRTAIRDAFDYPTEEDRRVGRVAFRDAVEFMLDGSTRAMFDDHWTAQTSVLDVDAIPYDVVGRFERFSDEFPAILKRLKAPPAVVELAGTVHNATRPMALAAVYDANLAGRVYTHYAADFESFGYAADSWRFD